MGDQEIDVISERFPDNPGELLAHILKNVLMDSRARANTSCGLSLWYVLFFALRPFSPGTPVFPSPQTPTFENSNLIRNNGR